MSGQESNVKSTIQQQSLDFMTKIQSIVEAALLTVGKPLDVDRIYELFDDTERPTKQDIRQALDNIAESCRGRGFELVRVASGYRFQVKQAFAPWVSRLWEERPQKYSRALLETLSLIAYRQPITRGDIEDIRGVAVSSNIMKTLMERGWVRIVGHKDVPGRPAMYATTRQFLDYFNMQSLEQLPPLSEIRDLEAIGLEIEQQMMSPSEGALPEELSDLPDTNSTFDDEDTSIH